MAIVAEGRCSGLIGYDLGTAAWAGIKYRLSALFFGI